jgi:cell division septum initiation protein DivIVA
MKSPDGNSHNHRNTTKLRAPNKINLMETISDNTSEQQIALSRFRDLEYANLQKLIRSNSIKHILEPLSPIKTSENKHRSSMQLNEILHSIDSLSYSKTTTKSKQKRTDIEKSLSKLGLLIF